MMTPVSRSQEPVIYKYTAGGIKFMQLVPHSLFVRLRKRFRAHG